MSNTLKIGVDSRGKAFCLPLETVTATLAILAIKGKGKTYLSDVLNEELMDAGQIPVIIDYTGAHWGLKSSADGKAPGFPVVIFGGEHADLPLEEGAGEVIARAIVEQRFAAIIDVSLLRKGAANRFIGDFLETLYRLNRLPVMLICDEADAYAPQKPFGDQARTLGAIEDIVRRGRIRGIGCTLITQRPQVINKNVLTQCEMLCALGMSHPKDIGAIKEWIDVHGDKQQADAMIASLPSLGKGMAWFWAPSMNLFDKVQVRLRHTFDSSATPKPGEARRIPQKLADIDITKLGKDIAATAERAKADDPKELKARIRQLEQEIAKKPAAVVPERVEVPVLSTETTNLVRTGIGEIGLLRSEMCDVSDKIEKLWKQFSELAGNIAKATSPVTHNAVPPKSESFRELHRKIIAPAVQKLVSQATGDSLDEPQQKILDTIRMLVTRGIEVNRESVARWMDIHPNGGRYNTNLAKLRADGYINGLYLTDKGEKAARRIDTGFEAAKEPLDGPQREMMDVLVHSSVAFTRESLAEVLGIHPNGGRYNTNLRRLRTMGLIPARGEIYLTEGARN